MLLRRRCREAEPARPEKTAVGAPADPVIIPTVAERDLLVALAEGVIGGPGDDGVGSHCEAGVSGILAEGGGNGRGR